MEENAFTLHQMANALFGTDGCQLAAGCLYLQAHIKDPFYLPAFQNVENLLTCFMNRWHFKMINDVRRARRYFTAFKWLNQFVCKHSNLNLLEIGSGSGLLSILLQRAGFKHIVACDEDPVQFCLSWLHTHLDRFITPVVALSDPSTLMQNNDNKECKFDYYPCSSLELTISETCSSFDVIVCEIFDAAFFGEKCISTLIDAHKRLLRRYSERTPVEEQHDARKCDSMCPTIFSGYTFPHFIPMRARIVAFLVESDQLRRRHTLVSTAHIYKQHGINVISHVGIEETVPYDAESLLHIDYRLLSDSVLLYNVDLCDLACLMALEKDKRECNVPICAGGRADAIVVCFQLELVPGIFLSTIPNDRDYCRAWDQAVFPVRPDNIVVKEGSFARLAVSICEERLNCQLLVSDVHTNSPACVPFPSEDIRLINDERYVAALELQLQKARLKLYADRNSHLNTNVVAGNVLVVSCSSEDLRCVADWPIRLLWLGYETVVLYCQSQEDCTLAISRYYDIMRRLHIPLHRFSCINADIVNTNELCPFNSFFDVLFNPSVIFADGSLCTNAFSITSRLCFSGILRPNCAILPHSVEVIGQLIYSDELEDDSCVKVPLAVDDDVAVDVGTFTNSFRSILFQDIDIRRCNYSPVSDKFTLMSCLLKDSHIVASGDTDRTTVCETIISSANEESMHLSSATEYQSVTAILITYKIKFEPNDSSESSSLFTSDIEAFNKAAIMFNSYYLLKVGQPLQIKACLSECSFNCYLLASDEDRLAGDSDQCVGYLMNANLT